METGEIERRFGTIALERGYITLDQLVAAMNSQVLENLKDGTHTPIGYILLEKGLLTVLQIQEVLRELDKETEEDRVLEMPFSPYQAHLNFRPGL